MNELKNAEQFYAFMLERERIRLRRKAAFPRERWTTDPILKAFKFTNVKREHDRTTYLLKERMYDKHSNSSLRELLLNCAIFRFFGTVEMAEAVGWTTWETDYSSQKQRLLDLAKNRLSQKQTVFTGAYIIPNCGDSRPKHEVVADIIHGIHRAIPKIISETDDDNAEMPPSWAGVCKQLTGCFGVGSFMAKEVILDFIMASEWMPDDWETWTPIGPGARRGAARVVSEGATLLSPLSETAALGVTRKLWGLRRELWPVNYVPFSDSGSSDAQPMVELSLTDIQFQLCEFDKYMRAKLGEGRPKSVFKPTTLACR